MGMGLLIKEKSCCYSDEFIKEYDVFLPSFFRTDGDGRSHASVFGKVSSSVCGGTRVALRLSMVEFDVIVVTSNWFAPTSVGLQIC